MPDKQHMETDEQFVDFGWSEMQKLLDDKMPLVSKGKAQNSRKALLAFFLFLGLLLVSSLWVMVRPDAKVAIGYLPIELTGGGTQQPRVIAAAVVPKEETETAGKTKSTPTRVIKKSASQDINLPKMGVALKVEAANTPIAQLDQEEQAEEQLVIPTEESSWLPEKSATALSEEGSTLQYLEPISSLSPEIAIHPTNPTFQAPGKIKHKLLDFWSVELEATSRKLNTVHGVGVNLLTNFELGKKGWLLSTGLGLSLENRPVELYAYQGELYDYDYLLSNADSLGLGTDFPETTDGESIPVTNSGTSVSRLAISANTLYLNLPLKLTKRFGHRWGAYLGGNLGYLLKASNNPSNSREEDLFVSGATNDVQIGTTYFDSNVSLRSKNAGFTPAALNQWQMALVGGIQYNLSPKWQIGLGYRHHLIGLIKDKEVKSGFSQARLSLNYRF